MVSKSKSKKILSNKKKSKKKLINKDLKKYEKKIYSQNGEDGITLEIIKRLYKNNKKQKYYVEFGTQDGSECNTRILRDKKDWNGLLMDGTYENKSINLYKEFITKENIVSLFNKYNVPNHFELLSIDIDFNDFYVLNEIVKNYTIDTIICEYNAYFKPNEDNIVIYKPKGRWNGSNYFGASLLAFKNLLNKYNYSLIYTENMGVNAFFIHNNLIKNKFINVNNIDKLYNTPKYGKGPRGGHPKDKKNRKYINSELILK